MGSYTAATWGKIIRSSALEVWTSEPRHFFLSSLFRLGGTTYFRFITTARVHYCPSSPLRVSWLGHEQLPVETSRQGGMGMHPICFRITSRFLTQPNAASIMVVP